MLQKRNVEILMEDILDHHFHIFLCKHIQIWYQNNRDFYFNHEFMVFEFIKRKAPNLKIKILTKNMYHIYPKRTKMTISTKINVL